MQATRKMRGKIPESTIPLESAETAACCFLP